MIKVNIIKNHGVIENISISGHSDYAEHGYDIVCAAVSSVVTTTINGILRFNETISFADDGNILKIEILQHDEITDKLIINMIELLQSIETDYKKNVEVLLKGE